MKGRVGQVGQVGRVGRVVRRYNPRTKRAPSRRGPTCECSSRFCWLWVRPSNPRRSPPAPFRLVEATIDEVRAALASKQITCRALVEQYIKRIEAYDKSGPALERGADHQPPRAAGRRAARCGVRGVGPGRSAALCSDARQRSGRDERHADDVRVGGVQGFHSAARRDDRHAG